MADYKYSDITEQIIGASMRVHSYLGNGFPEKIYQNCVEIEFRELGLHYAIEIEMDVFYKDERVGGRRADFIIEEKVLVELKAVGEITNAHYAQVLNYLKAYKMEVGLLINFGEESLQFKRFVL